MDFQAGYLRSSIGRKTIVAITGIIFFGFVFVHMLGNLQIFQEPDKINTYAEFLQSLGGLLWLARGILLVAFVLHVFYAIQLSIENKQARPVGYVKQSTIQATLSSRYMALTGSVILAFVIYHLLHFTFGKIQPENYALQEMIGDKSRHDVYSMVVLGFKNIYVSASYIFAMLLLAFHLRHGVASVFQTLGLNTPFWAPKLNAFAILYALTIFIGNTSMPVAVLLNFVKVSGAQ
ncbi:succinate dehydrogenase cytochrome b subunit [Leptospira wolffii]|uniref:Succinate:quinone oxidoreductase n=1 Tax=Leptospira wolffii TaxID=409998 RepID=A0A2M9Z8M2_9LEPT|nr:succinate dehydrogenase cytochrome b subunit [Leptospira wolffii]PJZ64775.1 succinate:quinone oxidoreductase [Leptospira wolffii]TGK56928.1 succinate dehydrogenase cytochrome b subunit [Leptospira wolffii]TGK70962.1 succinate dehydrogenase cytochrome b subunit [Leptospira wolffii]TGK75653.1 succinate dehydrogenase cytochrome b subunit [Leptospira wolffii]TGL32700.1 succinate dehydrogenase cytochrome b subunit [Leptospira wolffii]